jgi:ubiquinone/menaquinone biosynthesis C-methylase UbiE
MVEQIISEKLSDRFEKQYHDLRQREERIYSNQQIARLPDIESTHIHYREWMIRKISAAQLVSTLKKKNARLNILEIGCGNGWLSATIAGIKNVSVTGIDINRVELMQAVTVFEKKENLRFIYGDIRTSSLKQHAYDVIVFAACLQYFQSLPGIISQALGLLAASGEIHVIDTPFYSKKQGSLAAKRSRDYYASLGFMEMSDFYFHHGLEDLSGFNYRVVYNPDRFYNRFKRKQQPFYRILIKPS